MLSLGIWVDFVVVMVFVDLFGCWFVFCLIFEMNGLLFGYGYVY